MIGRSPSAPDHAPSPKGQRPRPARRPSQQTAESSGDTSTVVSPDTDAFGALIVLAMAPADRPAHVGADGRLIEVRRDERGALVPNVLPDGGTP